MAKDKILYVCGECGYESSRWLGKCPECNGWSSFIEQKKEVKKNTGSSNTNVKRSVSLNINDIVKKDDFRYATNIGELDRVLGGGIVKGSLVLIGGTPGIGKSTLLLQLSQKLGEKNLKVLYATGEESNHQIKIRADRLNVNTKNLYILAENDIENIMENIEKISPDIVIIDSIQTIYNSEITSTPGSVSQVREATNILMRMAKEKDISTIIVGHVTKEGMIAGPKVLEHMVDAVLYFEGNETSIYRIIRTIKNRFGSTNEIGVFEMTATGLNDVSDASKIMLSGKPENSSGSVITCTIEGTRALLLEVQALVTYTKMNMPRRTAIGIDNNRLSMLIAIIEKQLSINLSEHDVFLNIVGNIKITETALDLAIIVAIISSQKNIVVDDGIVIVGEVGLSGEVRTINMIEKRIIEAKKMGFTSCIIPHENKKSIKEEKINDGVIGIKNIKEIMKYIK
ncbi:MAG TPA: DNA repair protein RadA [Clostridiales bacterium]|nr:MAG: DNA repair protein RadA [Clostridiales bacterium GWD2_32_19]HCC06773.1 DNA repair protein RadA [Clostridiales bacterium]